MGSALTSALMRRWILSSGVPPSPNMSRASLGVRTALSFWVSVHVSRIWVSRWPGGVAVMILSFHLPVRPGGRVAGTCALPGLLTHPRGHHVLWPHARVVIVGSADIPGVLLGHGIVWQAFPYGAGVTHIHNHGHGIVVGAVKAERALPARVGSIEMPGHHEDAIAHIDVDLDPADFHARRRVAALILVGLHSLVKYHAVVGIPVTAAHL